MTYKGGGGLSKTSIFLASFWSSYFSVLQTPIFHSYYDSSYDPHFHTSSSSVHMPMKWTLGWHTFYLNSRSLPPPPGFIPSTATNTTFQIRSRVTHCGAENTILPLKAIVFSAPQWIHTCTHTEQADIRYFLFIPSGGAKHNKSTYSVYIHICFLCARGREHNIAV